MITSIDNLVVLVTRVDLETSCDKLKQWQKLAKAMASLHGNLA